MPWPFGDGPGNIKLTRRGCVVILSITAILWAVLILIVKAIVKILEIW
jgi:hypothetical protein